jgi:DNA-binding FrmR family transcriptional regulator
MLVLYPRSIIPYGVWLYQIMDKMVVEDRVCVSLAIQLAAVRSGVEGVVALVLNNRMKLGFHKVPTAGTDLESLAKAAATWGRVRGGASQRLGRRRQKSLERMGRPIVQVD